MSVNSSVAEGQVFAQHKAIRRRSSVLFNPPLKKDDGDEEIENDENVFHDSLDVPTPAKSRNNNNNSTLLDRTSSLASSDEKDNANVSNPFLERLKKDPRYSPLAIKRRQSSDSSAGKPSSSSSSSSKNTPVKGKFTTPVRSGAKSANSVTPGRNGALTLTTTTASSGTPKLKGQTPKLGTMSPLALRAINNQMKHDSTGKGAAGEKAGAGGKSVKGLPGSPGRVLLPNKQLFAGTKEGEVKKDEAKRRNSSFTSARGSSTGDEEMEEASLNRFTPKFSSPAATTASRRSCSMDLTNCSPQVGHCSSNVYSAAVSTSDESLLTPRSRPPPPNGDSDVDSIVETTPSSLPK